MIQLAEEQELERKALVKLARDKEERLKIVHRSEKQAEEQRLQKLTEEKAERQKLLA